jgi:DNA-binding NarL/FixJ family response regulator
MVWALLPLSFAIKFPVLSAFALLGLPGVALPLPVHERIELPAPKGFGPPVRLARIAAVFMLLVLLNVFNTLIHTQVRMGSLENNDLFSLLTWLTVPVSFLFFAFLTDLRRERVGFAIGIAMILIGCFTALIPGNGVLTAPLLLTGEFGGTITEFCFLTMPLMFFPFSKRPLLIAVSGLMAHTVLSSGLSWTQDIWLPEALRTAQIGRPLVIFGAVCAVLLIPLIFSAWSHHRDDTLISALLDLKRHTEQILQATSQSSDTNDNHDCTQPGDWTLPLDLLESEHRIALLLCEDLSRVEISERLDIPSTEVSAFMRRIHKKLVDQLPVGQAPYVLKAAKQYGLTRREAEVFGELLLGRSNVEISANLYIEESTVKTHVNKIMKKTGMGNRAELITYVRKENTSLPFH